jgi:hypothetical protein
MEPEIDYNHENTLDVGENVKEIAFFGLGLRYILPFIGVLILAFIAGIVLLGVLGG